MLRHISWCFWALFFIFSTRGTAQTCDPQVVFLNIDGEEKTDHQVEESAPLIAYFDANPQDTVGGWRVIYTWTIARQSSPNNPFLRRSGILDQKMDYEFRESGQFVINLEAKFSKTNFDDPSDQEYSTEEAGQQFYVTIPESKLELPNFFSPNGDGFNDIYRVKDGYQSIISFRASIFSRWGQRLYEWTDLNGGWDGRYNGSIVKDGVYFVVVEAMGADGKKYNIRKDVNLLTTHDKHDGTVRE